MGFSIPDSVFNRAFGHAVAAHPRKERGCVASLLYRFTQQRRAEITLDGIPRGIDGFLAVEGIFTGDAFSPTFGAVRMHGDQQDAALSRASKTGFEEMHQGHLDFAQRDCFNSHSSFSSEA